MLLTAFTLAMAAQQLQPVMPLPHKRQLAWQGLEFYAFCHFGPNTFTDKEWGEGKEDPNLFNPTDLDCNQWCKTFKDAGMKQVIITAKHHDGFCLWPTRYSTHTVAQSKWKDGMGDVLAELRKACNRYGLKMGVYLSPWDRNHPAYGTPEYNQVFANMLKEVLTKYGPIYEVWFDGANGEGPNGKKQVYDWDLFIKTVREFAPEAVIFSDAGPDIRWVGNEDGIAGETCWSMMDKAKVKIGGSDQAYLNVGDAKGPDWVPAECDVSIRPGWFYHAEQDAKVKSPETLLDLYERSVGRNGSFLLNVPPDRRGHIHEADVAALLGFKKLKDQVYGKNLVRGASASCPTGGSRPEQKGHSPGALTDGRPNTYCWIEGAGGFGEVWLEFKGPVSFNRVVLQEPVAFGQRCQAFVVEAMTEQGWTEIANGTTIGAKRILKTAKTTATKLKVVVRKGRGEAALSEIGLYSSGG